MLPFTNSAALWILSVLALTVIYLLPTLVGVIRRVDRLPLVLLVNLIGGPTGIGWLGAMILAFGPRRVPASPPLTDLAGGADGDLPGLPATRCSAAFSRYPSAFPIGSLPPA